MRKNFFSLAVFLFALGLCGTFFHIAVWGQLQNAQSVSASFAQEAPPQDGGDFAQGSSVGVPPSEMLQVLPTADYGWYTKDKKAEVFYIGTGEELVAFSEIVGTGITDFAGRTICLSREIDLQNAVWSPIGSTGKPFRGIFDGGGLNISNAVLPTSTLRSGFFAYLDNAVVKNLVITGFASSAAGQDMPCFGVVAAQAVKSSFINCSVTGADVNMGKADISRPVGGLVGRGESITIDGCVVSGSIVGGVGVGGVVGELKVAASGGNNVIKNSLNMATVSGRSYIGGIVGVASFSRKGVNEIGFSSNVGNIVGETYIGGIVGGFGGGIIRSCISNSAIKGTMYVGGIVGSLYSTVENCYTLGSVSGDKNGVGGIVGVADGSRISACYSLAELRGIGEVGGIVGALLSNDEASSLENVFALNSGVTSADRATAGRVVGRVDDGALLLRNKAWLDMCINGGYVGQNEKNGAGINLQSLKTEQVWSDNFGKAPWIYAGGGMPVLAGLNTIQNAKIAGHLRNHLDNVAAQLEIIDKLFATRGGLARGSGDKPLVEVSYNGIFLREKEDYVLQIIGESFAGFADFEIIGIGDYAKKVVVRLAVPSLVIPPATSGGSGGASGTDSNGYEGYPANNPPKTGDVLVFIAPLTLAVFSLFVLLLIIMQRHQRRRPHRNRS